MLAAPSIAPMTAADWESVRDIYNEGISTGNATFAQSAPEWEAWDAAHLKICRLVARLYDEIGSEIAGWAALSPYSSRCVYEGVAEVSVYVAAAARGQGVGAALMEALVAESERHGIWTLQAGIFPENVASVKLHERFGFRVVGVREKLGAMNGRWRDVLLLERRSRVVGQEHGAAEL